MTDLLIQTAVLSAVLVLAIYVAMRFGRSGHIDSSTNESEKLIAQNEAMQAAHQEQQDIISNLKQQSASSSSTITHLTSSLASVERKHAELQLAYNEQSSEMSAQKALAGKLSTQVEEKEKQLQQFERDISATKTDLANAQQRNLELSNLGAEQSEKLNHYDEVKAELAAAKSEIREAATKALELGSDNAELKEKLRQFDQTKTALASVRTELVTRTEEYRLLSNEKAEQAEKLIHFDEVKSELVATKQALAERMEEVSELKSLLSADVQAKQALQEKIELLETAEKRIVTQFENAANKIFNEQSGQFNQQSKVSIDALLSPLKQQIGAFSKQVTDVYTNEAKERHALKEEVSGLKALNEQMSKEATALTRALKGDNKKQGTWGEVVLERVLQESGLRRNHEYETQKNLKGDDGENFKPDIIVHLPGDKDVVIDSKMALTAYERHFNAESEVVEAQALKEHISAIKKHIKDLSGKNYQDLHGIKSLDYILMFIPVEPAFNAAIEHDPEIIQLALSNNIMLVSPTNLMVALKTINNMWRIEYQNVNAQDIAKKAGAIYDKLVGFVDDMTKLGNHMQRAEGSYNEAMKKLSSGPGNLIRRAEQMKELRIGNKKALPESLVEQSNAQAIAING